MTIACQTVNVLATGSLSIASTPAGAEIWLALGTPVDQGTTTLSAPGRVISGLVAGTYNIRLTLVGYDDWTGTATVTDGGTTPVSAVLTPSFGSASFSSTPIGAQIWVAPTWQSLAYTGFTTPNTVPNLSPGDYDYQLKLTGYYDEPSLPGTFTVLAGQVTVVPTITMVLVVGAITLSSTPSGVQIWLAPTGSPLVNQGVVTPATIGNLTPGISYTYELRHIDYHTKSGTFTLADGETITRSEILDLLPCPESPKYSGNTVTLNATPKDGIGPYYVVFRKNGSDISPVRLGGLDNPIINAPENIQITRIYTLDDLDISSALIGTIDFSVYMEDSCPTGVKTCTDTCTVTIGCVAPVCNFIVT